MQEGITFFQTGIPSGTASSSVAVYCPAGGAPTCVGGTLIKAQVSTGSSLLIGNLTAPFLHINVAYVYQVQSPVINTAGNIRYFPTPPTSGTVTLTLGFPNQEVFLQFTPQYLLQAYSDPLWTSTISASGVNGTNVFGPDSSQSLLSLWLVPGSTLTLTASVNPLQFTVQPGWIQWTDSSGCAVVGTGACGYGSPVPTPLTIMMAAPASEVANFNESLVAQVIPSTEGAYAGETVTTTVWSFGGIGTGTVSVNPALLPPGVTVSFYVCDPTCGAPQPNTLNFATSTDPPIGAGIQMQVTVSSSTTVFGAFAIPITVSYAGAAGQPEGPAGSTGWPLAQSSPSTSSRLRLRPWAPRTLSG